MPEAVLVSPAHTLTASIVSTIKIGVGEASMKHEQSRIEELLPWNHLALQSKFHR
jgi:hypothetical protein